MTVCSMTRFKVKVTSPCLGVCLCVCMSRCVCVYQVVHSRDGEMIYLGTQSVLSVCVCLSVCLSVCV